jgi:hypothetical protein
MLFWEAEYPEYGVVHHLLVLCFHMQHPSRYSVEGLAGAKNLLIEFVANETPPQAMRQRIRGEVASDKRTTHITARPDNKGSYTHTVLWTMTAADVARDAAQCYVENTRTWAQHVYSDLIASGNL